MTMMRNSSRFELKLMTKSYIADKFKLNYIKDHTFS